MKLNTALPSILTLAALTSTPAQAQWSNDSLSIARRFAAGVSVGDLALFAGGQDAQASQTRIDVYNGASGTWEPTLDFTTPRFAVMATRIGNYVMFAGGALDSTTQTNLVEVYDSSIGPPTDPQAWSTATLSQARFAGAATTVGGKAIFAGGWSGTFQSPVTSAVVDIYDSALGAPDDPLAWSATTLTVPRGGLSAVSVGGQALFAGGTNFTSAAYDTVDIYDDSTGIWTTESLSVARAWMGSTTVGTRAYFGGGQINGLGSVTGTVDIYDAAANTWTQDALPVARGSLSAVALGNTVLFAGGLTDGFVPSNVVDTLNVGTGYWSSSQLLSVARADMGATTVAGKALFAGGSAGFGQAKSEVDIYEPLGTNYCVAGTNSTGCAASISGIGSVSLASNFLVLTTNCVPSNVFIYFFAPNQQQLPFGNGNLCVGGTITRILPPAFASGGVAQTFIDLASVGITTPGARNFQCWFRDPAAGGAQFDTSDAIAISFVP
jgi:hypothetical protein